MYYEEKGENPEDMMITPGNYESGAFLGFTEDKYAGYVWRRGSYVIIRYLVLKQLATRKETLAEFCRFINYLREHRLKPIVMPIEEDFMLTKLAQEANMRMGTAVVEGESLTGYLWSEKKGLFNWFR